MCEITVLVVCKGRLSHLMCSLPYLLRQQVSAPYDVLVVDYDCPENTFDVLDGYPVHCVRVQDNAHMFNFPRALNIGIKFARGRLIYKCDADRLPEPDSVERLYSRMHTLPLINSAVTNRIPPRWVEKGVYEFPRELDPTEHRPTCVDMLFTVEAALRVRGFDEAMCGWGYEDCDFRNRINLRYGITDHKYVPYHGRILDHSEEESTKFYANKNKVITAAQNLSLLRQEYRTVNPAGFGITNNFQYR